MIVSICEVRKIMGNANKKYTDEQIEEVISIFSLLSDLAIDKYIKKDKEIKAKK